MSRGWACEESRWSCRKGARRLREKRYTPEGGAAFGSVPREGVGTRLTAANRGPRGRLIGFALLFLVATAAGIAVGMGDSGFRLADLGTLAALPVSAIAWVAVLCAGMYAGDVLRFRALGAAVGVRVSLRAAVDAVVANFFFSWITPGSALGEPAAVYMLGRWGVPWETAAIIAFGKSLIGAWLLLMSTFVILAAGLGPEIGETIRSMLLGASALVSALLGILLAGVYWPARLDRWIVRAEELVLSRAVKPDGGRVPRWARAAGSSGRRAVARLAKFRAAGPRQWLAILGAQLVFFGCFVGTLVVLLAALGYASAAEVTPSSIVYLAVIYHAPTPGGSGIAEAVATPFFEGLVPAKEAFLAGIAFRAGTYYLHIAVGSVYLPVVGGVREILRHREPAESEEHADAPLEGAGP